MLGGGDTGCSVIFTTAVGWLKPLYLAASLVCCCTIRCCAATLSLPPVGTDPDPLPPCPTLPDPQASQLQQLGSRQACEKRAGEAEAEADALKQRLASSHFELQHSQDSWQVSGLSGMVASWPQGCLPNAFVERFQGRAGDE